MFEFLKIIFNTTTQLTRYYWLDIPEKPIYRLLEDFSCSKTDRDPLACGLGYPISKLLLLAHDDP